MYVEPLTQSVFSQYKYQLGKTRKQCHLFKIINWDYYTVSSSPSYKVLFLNFHEFDHLLYLRERAKDTRRTFRVTDRKQTDNTMTKKEMKYRQTILPITQLRKVKTNQHELTHNLGDLGVVRGFITSNFLNLSLFNPHLFGVKNSYKNTSSFAQKNPFATHCRYLSLKKSFIQIFTPAKHLNDKQMSLKTIFEAFLLKQIERVTRLSVNLSVKNYLKGEYYEMYKYIITCFFFF